MIEPLTEREIRDLIDGPGPLAERVVVYGWDRIFATLVLANVLRKRFLPPAPEEKRSDARYSDLMSDGGMDPRRHFDAYASRPDGADCGCGAEKCPGHPEESSSGRTT